MEDLADWLALQPFMERPVVDRTGLTDSYSFTANLFNFGKGTGTDELKAAMSRGDAIDEIFSTLSDQLGLKLESRKVPIEVLIVDQAEKVPTEN